MAFAVLFDMDGVIVDSNPYHKLAFQAFLKKYNRSLTDDELKTHVYGRTNQEGMPYIFQRVLAAAELAALADEKEALFREMYQADIRPVAGLMPFLQMLQRRRVPMAVGTSAPGANLDFVLDSLGIRSYFGALLDSAFVTRGKPDPEIYLKAAAELGTPPNQCVVIEDSLAGVRAGLNAGAKVIGITTTHTAEELANTHLVIQSFEGLTVDQLEALW
ncbi:MAG: HAD family phosphatase [Ferruginibacter sp.]|nr:HAD family phosphatase [Cytophagales bacterium]